MHFKTVYSVSIRSVCTAIIIFQLLLCLLVTNCVTYTFEVVFTSTILRETTVRAMAEHACMLSAKTFSRKATLHGCVARTFFVASEHALCNMTFGHVHACAEASPAIDIEPTESP